MLREAGSPDTQWGPSRALLQHTDPYAAYLYSADSSPFILSQRPNYPASGLILMWPYAVWDWPTAKALWALSNLLFTGVILLCLFRLLPADTEKSTKLLLTSLFLMGTPWRVGIANGQHALFSLCFLLVSVVELSRRRFRVWAPLAISWFKYTIALPLSLLFVRSRSGRSALLAASLTHGALTVFAASWTHTSPVRMLLGPIEVARSLSLTERGYLDVFVIGATLGVESSALAGVAGLAILFVTYVTLRHDRDDLSSLSTLALASMTISFHRMYDFIVLVIPLAYAVRMHAKGFRAQGYLLVVGIIWFLDRVVVGWPATGPAARVAQLFLPIQEWPFSFEVLTIYFWFKVLVFYGVLFGDWLTPREPGVETRVQTGVHGRAP